MPQIMTAQEFNRQVSRAQQECENSPVFVTHRGNLAYVLLNYQEYRRLAGKEESIAEALAAPQEEIDVLSDIEFERVYIAERPKEK
ncbi:type II toxin-antitoxin system Phd/YefM family antitoxin [Neisseria sp.]|uniref:type II toxin-antitoxin system Phd/YefM family antitoxin n=1 Tax=Neisseria sp. TaxID=192066 RepID=UPI0035A0F01E